MIDGKKELDLRYSAGEKPAEGTVFSAVLAIDQEQKRVRGAELAKYLQQRLNLRNVAPERQKTTLGAFCSQD